MKRAKNPQVLVVEDDKKRHEPREKNPKVPIFPALVEATAQKLREKIDARNEQSPLAYGALTRLCVLWSPNTVPCDKAAMVNDLVRIMATLFPKE